MSIGNIANTGMKASMTEMEVISNNISNANTIGFKKSYANFVDAYSSGGAGAKAGLGVSVATVRQNFETGGVEMTGGQLDMMINNDSFFIMKDSSSGQSSYTRAGRFEMDAEGYIKNGNQRLQGFSANNGVIMGGSSTSDLKIDGTAMPASATKLVTNPINLDSNGLVIATPFDDKDPTTYNFRSDVKMYDSLGNPNTLTLFYVKTGDNTWNVNTEVNGTAIGTGTMTFTTGGALLATTGLDNLSFNPTSGAASPQAFDVKMTGSTQVAQPNDAGHPKLDGYEAGTLENFRVDNNGMVNLYYTNGQTQVAGQVALANFQAPQGLSSIGNMSWIQTSESGNPMIAPGNSIGNLNAGSLELSNVDLTDEMVNLIGAQHNFQANAQVEQVYNEVMQTVIKM